MYGMLINFVKKTLPSRVTAENEKSLLRLTVKLIIGAERDRPRSKNPGNESRHLLIDVVSTVE